MGESKTYVRIKAEINTATNSIIIAGIETLLNTVSIAL